MNAATNEGLSAYFALHIPFRDLAPEEEIHLSLHLSIQNKRQRLNEESILTAHSNSSESHSCSDSESLSSSDYLSPSFFSEESNYQDPSSSSSDESLMTAGVSTDGTGDISTTESTFEALDCSAHPPNEEFLSDLEENFLNYCCIPTPPHCRASSEESLIIIISDDDEED